MTALFEAVDVIKTFGGLTALQRVSFALDGGIASIIGPNGAGKTTLFNVFTGLYRPDSGVVSFRGQPLIGLRPDQITALGVCRTFQNIRLFANMTAAENVLVGMHARIRLGLRDVLTRGGRFVETERGLWQRAAALLDRVGLRGKANEVARNLPYGEQRRLELARALASEPALLLLDEPTAGMTQSEAGTLMSLLRRLVGDLKLAIVLIEHNMRVVALEVRGGEIVTLLGNNGAGKSTTLKTISGLLAPRRGSVVFDGSPLTGVPAHEVVARGIAHVPEGRRIFNRLTIRENLTMGAYLRTDADIDADLDRAFELFPRLKERISQVAGTLSGGEQQMLAIARALMARPRLLLLDEPSMGLAPVLVEQIFTTIGSINRQGTTILLVEQNAAMALSIAHRGYVLETGAVVLSGSAGQLAENERVRHAYLGE